MTIRILIATVAIATLGACGSSSPAPAPPAETKGCAEMEQALDEAEASGFYTRADAKEMLVTLVPEARSIIDACDL